MAGIQEKVYSQTLLVGIRIIWGKFCQYLLRLRIYAIGNEALKWKYTHTRKYI